MFQHFQKSGLVYIIQFGDEMGVLYSEYDIIWEPKSKTIIYLAHSGNRMAEGKELQQFLEKNGFEVINPFDYDENARHLAEFWNGYPELRENKELCKDIVKKDLDSINKADILVAQVLEPSIGTSMEIFYAFTSGKRICILTEIVSPWLMHHSNKIVKTKEELLEELRDG